MFLEAKSELSFKAIEAGLSSIEIQCKSLNANFLSLPDSRTFISWKDAFHVTGTESY